jgi:lipopolysaccharide transport system ATP-binding protein
MEEKIIQIENVSKQYVIRHENADQYTALRDVMANAAKSVFHRVKSPLKKDTVKAARTEIFLALKDVSFDISRGERIGVIGRNGAGKSTLLKVLSRITEPTKGSITLHGRVASLLEVGTGFHPELTGRENIFLNGSILGMKRTEITSKFDEIVAFAEIDRFLDTPVKRYSSGMYVRLAFAVAAHLEPEILLIDEVLAVGDTAFQKKCLGKMEDISIRSSRTVIFVSHNMAAIRALCNRCVLLSNGQVEFNGDVSKAVEKYLEGMSNIGQADSIAMRARPSFATLRARIIDVRVLTDYGENPENLDPLKPIRVQFRVEAYSDNIRCSTQIIIADELQSLMYMDSAVLRNRFYNLKKGINEMECRISPLNLYSGSYRMHCILSVPAQEVIDRVDDAYRFQISELDPYGTGFNMSRNINFGIVHVDHEWI